jgi:hypothetical protein
VRGELRTGRLDERVEAKGAGQVIEGEVQARAGLEEILDLGSGSERPRSGSRRTSTISGTRQPEVARDLPGHQLSDERLATLPGAAELEHIGPRSSASTMAGSEPPSRRGVT